MDGSFVEDVENGDRNRPPSDIDLVTWVYVPDGLELESFGEWFGEIAALHQLLGPKENFKCDAYLVPMMSNGLVDMNEAIYWSGLFSHSRDGETWKGFFQVELADDENEAMMILEEVAK